MKDAVYESSPIPTCHPEISYFTLEIKPLITKSRRVMIRIYTCRIQRFLLAFGCADDSATR
jgi:hypothetical protein